MSFGKEISNVIFMGGIIYGAEHFVKLVMTHEKKLVDFRLPREGETYVALNGEVLFAVSDTYEKGPRLILRAPRKITITDVVFRPVIEGGKHAVRVPKRGEWFMVPDKMKCACLPDGEPAWPIYTRHEETREIEVDE